VTGIDTVVYDFGNVLVRWDPRGACAGFDPVQVEEFFTRFDFAAFNHLQDAGRPLAEGRAAVAASEPRWLRFVDAYVAGYAGSLGGPVRGSAELVAELKRLGVRLYGLTNWWAETYHHAERAAPAIGLLDGVVVSGRVGVAKPDPAIFRTLMSAYDVDPHRAVFVDDSQANVDAAAALGFHAVRFTTTPALRRALQRRGLPVEQTSDQ
jgi:2-haloacid dehalogenase